MTSAAAQARLRRRFGRHAVMLSIGAASSLTLAWPLSAAGPVALHQGMALFSAASLFLASWADRQGRLPVVRTLGGLGALVGTSLALLQRPGEPGPGLVMMVSAGAMVILSGRWLGEASATGPQVHLPSTAISSLAASLVLLSVEHTALPLATVALPMSILVLASAVADRRGARADALRIGMSAGLVALVGLAAIDRREELAYLLTAITGPLALLSAMVQARSRTLPAFARYLSHSPARAMVLTFAILCASGGAILTLPFAATNERVSVIDALFTSVSAACVTGLAVVDTPTTWSFAGELVILLLIQVGGLGIMTFASAASVWLGRRMSLESERTAAELLGPRARSDLRGAVGTVVALTIGAEALGAVCLMPAFLWHGDGFFMALWRSVFTSISAFCNAGFGLQSDNLVPYAGNPWVLLVVSLLIIFGGLGPVVVANLRGLLRGRGSLHGKLVISTTAVLLLLPTFLILAFEWNNSLSGLAPLHKLTNAWFQSVTTRTAGFNSVDMLSITPATWTVMILCMFVGGSPGSTAGGAKTTTVAVLALAIAAAVRGRSEAQAFGRRIRHKTVVEAAAVSTAGVFTAITALIVLQITQHLDAEVLLFEVVSALGTVGLSVGATTELDSIGKIVIILCMFAGRVGPLTFFIFLAERERDHPGPRPPLESVPIG